MDAARAVIERRHGVARDDYQVSLDMRACEGVVQLRGVMPCVASFIHRELTDLVRESSVGTLNYVRETSVRRVVDEPPWDFVLRWKPGKYMAY